jgi:hypothetical protein
MNITFSEEQICYLEDCIINKLAYPLWLIKQGYQREAIKQEEFISAEQNLDEIIKFLRDLRK